MTKISSLCVYCGSRKGNRPDFEALAEKLGEIMAANGIELVYGAGSIGLMGVIARSVLRRGGKVTGIIPTHLEELEILEPDLTELHVVTSMHERKKLMFDRSDAFIVLPGGAGTLDEMIEVITWSQLNLHDKPIILVNHQGYWDPFVALIDHVIANGFADEKTRALFQIVESVDDVLPALAARPTSRMEPETALL